DDELADATLTYSTPATLPFACASGTGLCAPVVVRVLCTRPRRRLVGCRSPALVPPGVSRILTPGDAGPEATPPRHGPERKALLAEDQGAEAMSTACGEEHTRDGTPGVSEAQRCPSQGDVP